MWSISQWIDVICSREPPVKLELPCFECCVFGEPRDSWEVATGNPLDVDGANGDNWNDPPKVEVPPFQTICQWFHVVPVPRASPSPREFVRGPSLRLAESVVWATAMLRAEEPSGVFPLEPEMFYFQRAAAEARYNDL